MFDDYNDKPNLEKKKSWITTIVLGFVIVTVIVLFLLYKFSPSQVSYDRAKDRVDITQKYIDLMKQYQALGYLDQSARDRLTTVIARAKADLDQSLYGSDDYVSMESFTEDFTNTSGIDYHGEITHFTYPDDLTNDDKRMISQVLETCDMQRVTYLLERKSNHNSEIALFKKNIESEFSQLRQYSAKSPEATKQVAVIIKHFYDKM